MTSYYWQRFYMHERNQEGGFLHPVSDFGQTWPPGIWRKVEETSSHRATQLRTTKGPKAGVLPRRLGLAVALAGLGSDQARLRKSSTDLNKDRHPEETSRKRALNQPSEWQETAMSRDSEGQETMREEEQSATGAAQSLGPPACLAVTCCLRYGP